MASRLQIAKPDIVETFEKLPKVLRRDDIAAAFRQNREFWRLAQRTTLHEFIAFLLKSTPLKEIRFPFPQREVVGFSWGGVPAMQVLQALVPNSYYSHYTAVQIHGLTEQLPKTIYLTQERVETPAASSAHSELVSQEAIDESFQRPPRVSHNEIVRDDLRFVLLSGAYHGQLGVTVSEYGRFVGLGQSIPLRHTNLERTLIDITVRPFYSGGVFEVAKAFENAKDRVSVNTMAAMLRRMHFGYPYHQAIGLYLERAGYKETVVDIFRKMPMDRDFYLTHQIGESTYVPEWRLFVPKGF